MAIDWTQIRAEFPALKNFTYLNTATFGQLPRCASAAMQRHIEHRDETACSDFLKWFDDADEVRALLGRLIHCASDDIAFVSNASSALAILMNGLDWQPGDRIVSLAGE